MARSYIEYTGDGVTTQFAVPFAYISQDHVHAAVDGEEVELTWINSGTVEIDPAPADQAHIKIYRETSPDTRLVDYNVPGTLTEEDLDNDSLQAFYMAQEAVDTAQAAMVPSLESGQWDGQGKRLTNIAPAVEANDAVSKADLDAAALAPVTPAAGSISVVPAGNVASTDVQSALEELQGDIDTINVSLPAKAPLDSPRFTGTPEVPTTNNLTGGAIPSLDWVNNHAGRTVRQTALFGHVDSNGYADFLTTGSGLRPGLLASSVAAIFSYSNGMQEVVEKIAADNADILGANLPASNTSFIYKDRGGSYGSTLVPPQYGYAFDRGKGALLNFDGADGSTTFKDDFGNTWTAVGNAQLDTSQKKFGASSLLLDGTGDYVSTGNITTMGDGSWEVSCWFRISALPGAGNFAKIFGGQNAGGFGVSLYLHNTAGTTKLELKASSNGTSADIANFTAGSNTTWALNQWNKVRLVFDALAGTYKVYLSLNAAAETADISVSSTARICAMTEWDIGADAGGNNAFNGHIDAFRFVCCATNTSAETPSAVAPAITDYPYNFFSIPEMKMYEVTGASSAAGSNPAMTQRYRLFLGECDTGAASITAARTYALRGQFRQVSTSQPSTSTSIAFAHNLGVIPQYAKVFLQNVSQQFNITPGMEVHMLGNYYDGTNYRTHAVAVSRSVCKVAFGNQVPTLPDINTGGANSSLTPERWRVGVVVERGW